MLFLVAVAAGAVARSVVDQLVGGRSQGLPWGTIVINVSGSFVLGFLTGLGLYHAFPTDARLVLGTGFCGAYTTFPPSASRRSALERRAEARRPGQRRHQYRGRLLAAAAGLAWHPVTDELDVFDSHTRRHPRRTAVPARRPRSRARRPAALAGGADRPAPTAAELTASVLTDDGWATIVVRTPGDIEVVHWPVTAPAAVGWPSWTPWPVSSWRPAGSAARCACAAARTPSSA